MDSSDTMPLPNEEDLAFGWFSCKPRWLQGLNKAVWFLVFMAVTNCFYSMVSNGLVGVVLSSLETRFDLTASQVSWIPGIYDMAAVPVILIISYVGSRAHRPLWTGIGTLIVCLGTLLFSLPHFTTDLYNPTGDGQDFYLCSDNSTSAGRCDEAGGDAGLQGYLAVFILARVLQGVGSEPLLTLAVTYLDDCVTRDTLSLYIAIFYMGAVIGPALAFIFGGYLLNVYTDFYQVATDSIGIEPTDPRWVGAWWVGFLLGGIALFFLAIPFTAYARDLPGFLLGSIALFFLAIALFFLAIALFFLAIPFTAYARYLPGGAAIRAKRRSEAHNATEESHVTSEMNMTLRQIPGYLKDLFCNPSWVFQTLFMTCEVLIISGFTAFGPKYVESQFNKSPAQAGVVFGLVALPGCSLGLIVGGAIIKRFQMTCKTILKWEVIFSITILLVSFIFFIYCDAQEFAGLNIPYENSTSINLTSACNMGCGCGDVAFSPVCGVDNVQYYSPCHAGCLDEQGFGRKEYFNCSCVGMVDGVEVAATSDTCDSSGCSLLPYFLVTIFIAMFLQFCCQAMNLSVIIRCVPMSHRTFAIGLASVITRLIGGFGGPLLFGVSFDGACSLWDEYCGKRGSCLIYQPDDLSINMTLLNISVKIASTLFIILAWRLYKAPKDYGHVVDEKIGPPMPITGEINEAYLQDKIETYQMTGPDTSQQTKL